MQSCLQSYRFLFFQPRPQFSGRPSSSTPGGSWSPWRSMTFIKVLSWNIKQNLVLKSFRLFWQVADVYLTECDCRQYSPQWLTNSKFVSIICSLPAVVARDCHTLEKVFPLDYKYHHISTNLSKHLFPAFGQKWVKDIFGILGTSPI